MAKTKETEVKKTAEEVLQDLKVKLSKNKTQMENNDKSIKNFEEKTLLEVHQLWNSPRKSCFMSLYLGIKFALIYTALAVLNLNEFKDL